jgi:cellulose synthase/poly-beta-1,6-N-acetylglucosamine synthase-like glycosyltransferase
MHILLAVAGLALLLATLPLVAELLVLSLAAIFPAAKSPTVANVLRLFVIIPAHNEQALIAACVRSIVASKPPQVEVLVIAHNCTDSTADRAVEAGATVLPLNGEGGKGHALNFGFQHALAAGAEAVLVIDADSNVAPNLIPAVLARLAAGAQALQTRYQVANASASTRTRLMELALLGMNTLRPRGRARLGLSCGIFGNGFALTAATLARVPYLANSVVEDLEYHLHLLRSGIRVVFVDDTAVFGEMPATDTGTATQRARWEGGRILMRRQWTRPLVKQVLTGRLRMIEPLLDLLALPLATGTVLLSIAAAIPLHWVRAWGVLGLVAVLLYLLVAASLGPTPAATLRALFAAPAYIVWKILMIPATRRASRRDAAWVRTQRNSEPEETGSTTDLHG